MSEGLGRLLTRVAVCERVNGAEVYRVLYDQTVTNIRRSSERVNGAEVYRVLYDQAVTNIRRSSGRDVPAIGARRRR